MSLEAPLAAQIPQVERTERNLRFIPIATALLLAGIYVLPYMLELSRGGDGTQLIQQDEPFYLARFTRALSGESAMSPVVYEHRADLSVVPGFFEHALAAPFRLGAALGLPVPGAPGLVVMYRAVFAVIGALSMIFAFQAFGMGGLLASFVTLWAYVDPGLYSYKPILGLRSTGLVLSRFPNPAAYLSLMFLAIGCYVRALQARERAWHWTAAAGVLAGLVFYTTFYFWTFLFAFVALSVLLDPRRHFPRAFVMGAIAAVVAAYYVFYALDLRAQDLYTQLLWRTNFYEKDVTVSITPNKTQWLFVLIACLTCRHGPLGMRLLLATVLGGTLCQYSAIVTGLPMPSSAQNGHWNYELAPVTLAACAWGTLSMLKRTRLPKHFTTAAWVAAAVLLASGVRNFVRLDASVSSEKFDGCGETDPAYASAWSWLKTHADENAVVLASESTMAHVPFRAGKYIWIHSIAYPDLISFEETLDRYRVYWWLTRQQPASIENMLLARFEKNVTRLWRWGLPADVVKEVENDGWPRLEVARWRQFSHRVAAEFGATSREAVKQVGSRYKLDYLVRGPSEQELAQADEYLQLTPVYRSGAVRIDHIDGWR